MREQGYVMLMMMMVAARVCVCLLFRLAYVCAFVCCERELCELVRASAALTHSVFRPKNNTDSGCVVLYWGRRRSHKLAIGIILDCWLFGLRPLISVTLLLWLVVGGYIFCWAYK